MLYKSNVLSLNFFVFVGINAMLFRKLIPKTRRHLTWLFRTMTTVSQPSVQEKTVDSCKNNIVWVDLEVCTLTSLSYMYSYDNEIIKLYQFNFFIGNEAHYIRICC